MQYKIYRCDMAKQYEAYKHEIDEALRNVLQSGCYVLGRQVNAFEKEFADYLNINFAIGVGNATDGLILSLMALGIGRGDEVVTTPFTAIPTVSAILDVGATPVFVDVDAETYLMNVDQVGDAITKKTKAIIPVHLFGNVVNIPKLRSIIGGQISIIEDASQSHGAKLNNVHAGTMGDIGVFSFYPTKNLGGYGDGGIVVTGDEIIGEKIRKLRMYGMTDKDHFSHAGINSRLDELQAAILRTKLKYLDRMNDSRNKIASRYIKYLRKDLFKHQKIDASVCSAYHVFVSRLAADRDRFIKYMDDKGIQTNIYYPIPLHFQRGLDFLCLKKGIFPQAEMISEEVIALPFYPELTLQDQDYVIGEANKFF